ncbi:MAG: hypothetical protein IRY83_13235 [Chloroflexi bacterium]|nr:hypothetical protein [Chloroflexota bacterium]
MQMAMSNWLAWLAARRTFEMRASRAFYDGDHWQGGDGWIGARPPLDDAAYTEVLALIRSGFISENVIAEVVDRHVDGVLGREPLWSMLADNPASLDEVHAALTRWWNARGVLRVLREALTGVLVEGRASLRVFVPAGVRDERGQIPVQPDLDRALGLIYLEALPADVAGIYWNPQTRQPCSVVHAGTTDVELGELRGELTEIRIEDQQGVVRGRTSLRLGGHLLVHELAQRPLVTEQVRQLQRALNLDLTMLTRNINLAGSAERVVLNAEPPTEEVDVPDASVPGGLRRIVRRAPYRTGPGAVNFLVGVRVVDESGRVLGRANPNISYRDPVRVDTFERTRRIYREAILSQCDQLHVLIAGDATSSGEARKQARASFETSLRRSKVGLDAAGRWLLEVVLRLAAQFCGRDELLTLRADFNAQIDTGPPSSEDRRQFREDVQAGIISRETARLWLGIDDPDAEAERIRHENESAG